MENFFDRIQKHYNKKLPFVVYRKPNSISVKALLQNDSDLHITRDFTESGFVFAPFDDSEATVLIPANKSQSLITDFEVSETIEKSHFNPVVNDTQKQQHIALVEKGIEAIKNDLFKKVVLSRHEIIPLSNTNPIVLLKKLLNNYAAAYTYCWYHPNIGLWLGVTPETLIEIDGKHFSMMALAGTQDYQGALDVTWQDKELQEQQYVTDFILDNLKPFAKEVKLSNTETIRAGNLLHLKTIITAQLRPGISNIKQLIFAVHPTPAVCGYPKLAAKKFILEKEQYYRGFYTGFLGELNIENAISPRTGKRNIENRAYSIKQKSTQLYVNLRCMQIEQNQAVLYAGGGITESSNPESEWQETVSKTLAIKNVL